MQKGTNGRNAVERISDPIVNIPNSHVDDQQEVRAALRRVREGEKPPTCRPPTDRAGGISRAVPSMKGTRYCRYSGPKLVSMRPF